MKRIVALIFLSTLGIVSIACAQTLTANEMIEKTKCQDVECFRDFAIKKGFNFKNFMPFDNLSMYTFESDKIFFDESGEKVLHNAIYISLEQNPEAAGINIMFTDKDYYTKLLDEFKSKGFILNNFNSLNTANKIVSSYNSKQHPDLSLMVTTMRIEAGKYRWTWYNFGVTKNKYLKVQ